MIYRNITFTDIDHSYIDEYKNKYTSVTTLIGKYENKFDSVKEAIKYAQKHGNTPEYWLEEWDRIKNIAIDKGNREHNNLELNTNKINGEVNNATPPVSIYDIRYKLKTKNVISLEELEESPLRKQYPIIYTRLKQLIYKGFTLYTEKICYHPIYLVAGKIDLIAVNEDTLEFFILDWKTNKDELKFKAGYYKKHNGIKTLEWVDKDERLKFPLNDLQQCKGIIYTLQLSSYAYLTEILGYKLLGIELYHIRENNIFIYEITYLKNKVEQMMEHHATSGKTIKPGFKIV